MEKEIVDKINRSNVKLSMVVTGGGSRFIGDFLSHSGGSNTILDFQVPYSQDAHEEYVNLEKIPYKYVSEEAAFELANAAYEKMEGYVSDNDYLLGVSVTAALIKDNEREGRENHFYVGVADSEHIYVHHVKIDKKTLFWRLAQEVFVSDVVLSIIDDPESHPYKKFLRNKVGFSSLPKLMDLKEPVSFFVGSFNPWHDGHQAIYDDLKTRFGSVILELSIYNRDKATELESVLRDRVKYLNIPYIITHVQWITEKIDYFRSLGFEKINIAMGLDTWARFVQDGFNKEDLTKVSFTVYNRHNGQFDDHGLNAEFVDGFDMGISSTQIRERKCLTNSRK